jgi:hypothetical protein
MMKLPRVHDGNVQEYHRDGQQMTRDDWRLMKTTMTIISLTKDDDNGDTSTIDLPVVKFGVIAQIVTHLNKLAARQTPKETDGGYAARVKWHTNN